MLIYWQNFSQWTIFFYLTKRQEVCSISKYVNEYFEIVCSIKLSFNSSPLGKRADDKKDTYFQYHNNYHDKSFSKVLNSQFFGSETRNG